MRIIEGLINCGFVQVLFLCVGSLLAHPEDGEGGPISCPDDKKVTQKNDMRRYIVWHHNRYRETGLQKVVTYDCDLEKEARKALKGEKIDTSKITKYDVLEFTDEIYKKQPMKEYLRKAMDYWYRYKEKHDIFYKPRTNRVGCAYKKTDFVYFVCVYNQVQDDQQLIRG
ncbi:hypothetical protein Y032_0010g1057 [Ancylostoma ceylanicum]|uniref:SCP domain-containing protein n=1 Tax=Ancylostoma ceylanicum TaxID=53326 RepID=A0A016VFR9_9BILA|nr:hypothetical protein Y032_0010g1057 [Ancylostoma ceylanicum]